MKDKEWAQKEIDRYLSYEGVNEARNALVFAKGVINQLDEPEVTLDEPEILSQEWVHENKEMYLINDTSENAVPAYKLQNLFVPKQEEVDRAYKDGYEKGKEYTFYKGYLEGLADKENEPETVADVVTTFWKSFERLKEVMSMEVEELEE